MEDTLENYFKNVQLKDISLNIIDDYMQQRYASITKEHCHEMIKNYIKKVKDSLDQEEAKEVARLLNELKVSFLSH